MHARALKMRKDPCSRWGSPKDEERPRNEWVLYGIVISAWPHAGKQKNQESLQSSPRLFGSPISQSIGRAVESVGGDRLLFARVVCDKISEKNVEKAIFILAWNFRAAATSQIPDRNNNFPRRNTNWIRNYFGRGKANFGGGITSKLAMHYAVHGSLLIESIHIPRICFNSVTLATLSPVYSRLAVSSLLRTVSTDRLPVIPLCLRYFPLPCAARAALGVFDSVK